MRYLLVIALLMLALPAAAQEEDTELICTTMHITHGEGGPGWSSVDYRDGGPRWTVVGSFVWFDYSGIPGGSAGAQDTISFDVSDPSVVKAIGCSDGSVTIEREIASEPNPATPTPPAPPAPEPVEEIVSLRPLCETYADQLSFYCVLPNQTLVIN